MKKITEAPVVFRTSWFDYAFADFRYEDEVKYLKWHTIFTQPRYRVSDTNETYRSINYWDERGLFLSKREINDSWRQFSIVDVVWMRILQSLKSVGMQSDALHKLKEYLFAVKDKQGRYAEFEFWIYSALGDRDISVVVLPDGRGIIATPQDVELHQMAFGLREVFVTVNFKQIVRSILVSEDVKAGMRKDVLVKLDKEEISLISSIRLEDVDTVIAHIKEGKLDRIEMRKVEQNPELLMEMVRQKLKESPNQTVTIKKQDDKVVFVEQRKSRKMT
jgi:DNA-binding transcriptional MerR regulator